MAHSRAVSKELSALADQIILVRISKKVKGYLCKIQIFLVQKSTYMLLPEVSLIYFLSTIIMELSLWKEGNSMKRIFSILIAVLLLAVLIPTAASAATVAEGTCGEKLTWTLDDAGTLTVSGTGSMPDFGFEEAPWFGHRASITQVILEPGVTNISWNSFDYCAAMTRIQIPDTVTRIDSNFYYCTGLTEVYIPANVTYLSGFAQCSSLSRLEVDPGNPNYSSRNNVLFNKDQTLLITYPRGLTGTYIFPDTVTGISTSAFNSCSE
jgi:hypothetical protein